MQTNILATILTLLVTNVAETIETDRINPWLNAVFPPPRAERLPDIRHVVTEVFEQRLLVLESEGKSFTNLLSQMRKLWKREDYDQGPAPWILNTNKVLIDTNEARLNQEWYSGALGDPIKYVNVGTNSWTTNILLGSAIIYISTAPFDPTNYTAPPIK